MFSLESPHKGDSNVYTQYTIFIIKRKSPQIILNPQLWDFFPGTQERVRNSHGKCAISVQATEVLLYLQFFDRQYLFRPTILLYSNNETGHKLLQQNIVLSLNID